MSAPAESVLPGVPPVGARRVRLLPLVTCFTLGALALLQLTSLPRWPWFVAAAVVSLWPWRHRWLVVAFVLGAALAGWRAQSVLDQRWPVARLNEEISVAGTIVSLPQAVTEAEHGPRESSSGDAKAKSDAATDSDLVPAPAPAPVIGAEASKGAGPASAGADDDRPASAAGVRVDENPEKPLAKTWHFLFEPNDPKLPHRIRVAWYHSAEAELHGGECWTLSLRLRTPHGGMNPGGFDYEGSLFAKGIGATGTVRNAQACGPVRGHWLIRMRQGLAAQFAAWLPGHPGLPLVSALAIGDTSGLGSEEWSDFRLTGTTHLVAISGFNVAIVAGIVFFVLRWSWSLWPTLCLRLPAQRAGLLGSALAALIYALLAGFDPPVERAAFGLLFLLAATWFGGLTQPGRALAVAWAIVISEDPLQLLSPGLWLSFGAVTAIFVLTSGRLGKRPGWRIALELQFSLSMLLAPMTLFWFQGTSLDGPLVNLVAVPISSLLTSALFAALVLAAIVPPIGIPALKLVATVLYLSAQGLGWVAAHAPQAWLAASPEPAALLLALIGAVLLFSPSSVPLRLLGMLCLGALLLPAGDAPREGDFRLVALDVGQGLAVVIRTHGHSLLFDAGPASPDGQGFDAGSAVVAPYLLKTGVRRLDAMLISHSDLDHRGGAPAVRKLIGVEHEIGALVPEACRIGQTWTWEGVRFEILNGPAPGLSTNDGGCVLRIVGAHSSALLPADIEAEGERRLLASGADLHADILLAPHHGSRTSSSQALIEAVQPKIVIHSAGWHHRFRHPSPEVVQRYRALIPDIRQFDTADSGAVIVDPDSGTIQVQRWRLSASRIWTLIDSPDFEHRKIPEGATLAVDARQGVARR